MGLWFSGRKILQSQCTLVMLALIVMERTTQTDEKMGKRELLLDGKNDPGRREDGEEGVSS